MFSATFVWAGEYKSLLKVKINKKLDMNCNDLRYYSIENKRLPSPPVKITWIKNGKIIQEGSQPNVSIRVMMLQIKNLRDFPLT